MTELTEKQPETSTNAVNDETEIDIAEVKETEKPSEPRSNYPIDGNKKDQILWCLEHGITVPRKISEKVYPDDEEISSYIYEVKKEWKDESVAKKTERVMEKLRGAKYVDRREEEVRQEIAGMFGEEPVKPTEEEVSEEISESTQLMTEIPTEIKPDYLEAVLRAINELYPEKYQRSDKFTKFVATLWTKPFNRLWSKYSESDPEIVICVVIGILYFAPPTIMTFKDWNEKRKAEKGGKEK